MKSLLIFTDWFAPGYKAGGPIKSIVNMVVALEDSLDIYIFTSDRDFKDKKPYNSIVVNQWLPYGQRSHIFYATPERLSYKTVKQTIEETNPHTIYLNSMWSIAFTLYPLIACRNFTEVRKVLAPRGMLQNGALNFKKYKKLLYLCFLNLFQINKNIIFHATDIQEGKDIGNFFKKNEISIISNYSLGVGNEIHFLQKDIKVIKLVFLSRISQKKNLLFIINLLSQVTNEIFLELFVYGPHEDKTYFEECELQSKFLPSNIKVNFEGSVHPNLINNILQNHHFFILPTLGENFGHSIFEAWSVGRPVIISDKTPWRKLADHKIGFDLSLEDPDLWVNTIERCALMSQLEFDEWCRSSHSFAQEYVVKGKLLEKYLKLFS
jgi:glycosyltransferase involved in cell wall biosynthesis